MPRLACLGQLPSNQRIGACHDLSSASGVHRLSRRHRGVVCRERIICPLGINVSPGVCFGASGFPCVIRPITASPSAKQHRKSVAGRRGRLLRAIGRRTHRRCYATIVGRCTLHVRFSLGLGPSLSADRHTFRTSLYTELPDRGRNRSGARRYKTNRKCHAVLLRRALSRMTAFGLIQAPKLGP
jgi:hypothetical protein